MEALATALHKCLVETLDLSENRIGPRSCFVLSSAFQYNKALAKVFFDGNPLTMQGA
jgi:hypothetical protein